MRPRIAFNRASSQKRRGRVGTPKVRPFAGRNDSGVGFRRAACVCRRHPCKGFGWFFELPNPAHLNPFNASILQPFNVHRNVLTRFPYS
jgi:hypothetical protein